MCGFAQHRGDNLAFQGVSIPEGNGVKAVAMGGAYTAVTGGVQSIYWNPAGMADINRLEISFQADSYSRMWQENQVFRPMRQFVMLSLILEGLHVPNPAFNGRYDYDAFKEDSTYTVKDPLLAEDVYSEKAADWQKRSNAKLFDNVAIAVPLRFLGKKTTIAASYQRKLQILDYDRNQTHLLPHIGYTYYEGLVPRVEDPSDSVRVHWSDYQRERTGALWHMNVALAIKMNKVLKLGAGLSRMAGSSDDRQSLDRIGYFDLLEANTFRFSYDTLAVNRAGNSDFSGFSCHFGAILDFRKLNVGVKLMPSYTITRKWNYNNLNSSVSQSEVWKASGEDKLTVPFSYNVGVSFLPTKTFQIAVDVQNTPYSKADFSYAYGDSTHRSWVNQMIVGVGVEFQAKPWLSLLGGYRNVPETYVPDGAAIKDRGPYAESITVGFSLKAFHGQFEAAYEMLRMKYYETYAFSTNYVLETRDRFLVGYTITL
jgi:hypothetical protein